MITMKKSTTTSPVIHWSSFGEKKEEYKTVFFITAMNEIKSMDWDWDKGLSKEERITAARNHSDRCFGYYISENEAVETVLENRCDIWEFSYDYVVIEEIGEGIHGYCYKRAWFKWDDGNYIPIKEPKEVEHIINFSIG